MSHERRQQLSHAEVVDGRTEKHRRLPAREILPGRELMSCAAHEFDFIAERLGAIAQEVAGRIARQPIDRRMRACAPLLGRLIDVDAVLEQVVDALQLPAHADRPRHGRARDLQHFLDFIEQLHRLAAFAIELVDERHDRGVAQPANLHEFDRPLLDALRAVDDHQRRVHRGESAIGVLGKILVARRVEQIHHAPVVGKLHYRGRHRDAALLLERHPVRGRVPRRLAALHGARELYRAAEQQQLFG